MAINDPLQQVLTDLQAPSQTVERRRSLLGLYLLLVPAVLVLIVWMYIPVLQVLRMAFFRWDANLPASFIGLDNFIELFSDKYFWGAIRNMGLVLLFQLTLPLLMPLLTAELINSLKSARARQVYVVLFLLPSVVPSVVLYLIWGYLYDQQGLLAAVFRHLHLQALAHNWLTDPHLALLALMLVGFPFSGGVGLLIYLAGLISIPPAIYDDARINGATRWQRFVQIDLAFCVLHFRLLIVNTLTTLIGNFLGVMLLTQRVTLMYTNLPGFYLYDKAFYLGRFGFACAVGLTLMAMALMMTIAAQRYLRAETEYNLS